MSQSRIWRILLEKAARDEYVIDKLIYLPDSPDDVIGFHLQQAAEKLLKALLSYMEKDYGARGQIGFDDAYRDYINNLNLVWEKCWRGLHPGCRLCITIGDQFA